MKIGDKVICVDFSQNEFYKLTPSLLPNVPYVVSEVGRWDRTGEFFINLIGVPAPFDTVGWRGRRFRLLSELRNCESAKESGQAANPCACARVGKRGYADRQSQCRQANCCGGQKPHCGDSRKDGILIYV